MTSTSDFAVENNSTSANLNQEIEQYNLNNVPDMFYSFVGAPTWNITDDQLIRAASNRLLISIADQPGTIVFTQSASEISGLLHLVDNGLQVLPFYLTTPSTGGAVTLSATGTGVTATGTLVEANAPLQNNPGILMCSYVGGNINISIMKTITA